MPAVAQRCVTSGVDASTLSLRGSALVQRDVTMCAAAVLLVDLPDERRDASLSAGVPSGDPLASAGAADNNRVRIANAPVRPMFYSQIMSLIIRSRLG
jgi:hypothetical protein